MTQIFCVEDDNSIRELVCYTLNSSGFQAKGFECASDFYDELKNQLPDLVILDIMLPDIDGMSVLKKLRSDTKTCHLPVIILSAKSDRIDKIKGLDDGADDYITKPFDILELISRIRAVIRRSTPFSETAINEITCGNISINPSSHTVSANGKEVTLTYKEYELLKILLLNKDIVMTRSALMDKVWGFDFEGETRTVDVHIRTLRQKLGACGHMIETVRNVGYKVTDHV